MSPRTLFKLFGLTILLTVMGGRAKAQTTADLFDINTLQEIRLTVNPADWTQFKANPEKNDYYSADLAWRGIVVRNLGIRQRGTGSRSGIKPYLGFKFDQYVTGQKFLGLSNLRMKNSMQDPSFMHERLSMLLFRRMGLPAPRESYARLYVNDEYSGLYVVMEEIDNTFLDRVFGEHGGCLYGYNWIDEYRFEYLGDDPSLYSPARFEPKKPISGLDPDALIEMIRTINLSPDDAFGPQVSQYLNLDLFLKHLAVENYLSEGDGIVGYAGMNNFYLYRLQGTKQFRLIAWDKDITFEDAGHSLWYNMSTNVLTRRIMEHPELKVIYEDAVSNTALEAGDTGGWLDQEVDRAYAQIPLAVLDDPFKPADYAAFEDGVEGIRNYIPWRLDYIVGEAGTPKAPSISANGIVNGASFAPQPTAAGSIASIFGANLGYTGLDAGFVPLPSTVDSTTAIINGIPVPLFFVSPTQINFQIPWELAGQTEASLTVLVGGLASTPQIVRLSPTSPGLFAVDRTGSGQGAILISGSSEFAAPSGSVRGQAARPVRRAETISVYCTGLGPVTSQPTTGEPPAELSLTALTPEVTVGGVPAAATFSGLAPGFVGLYQVNVAVPQDAPTGSAVPVVLTMQGGRSNVVTIAIQ